MEIRIGSTERIAAFISPLASFSHNQQTSPTVKAAAANPDLFRLLPSVDELLRSEALLALVRRFGHAATVEVARASIEDLRAGILAGLSTKPNSRFLSIGYRLLSKSDCRPDFPTRYGPSSTLPASSCIQISGARLSARLRCSTSMRFRRDTRIWNSILPPGNAASAMSTSVAYLRNC